IFLLMGGYITYLAFSNKLFVHSEYQVDMNILNAKFLQSINGFVTLIPEYIWALLFIGVIVYVSTVFIKQYKNKDHE
ncbi:MAG: hypothetical protein B7W98_02655, partial [Parcubacteria group bacterium 20-58-5]